MLIQFISGALVVLILAGLAVLTAPLDHGESRLRFLHRLWNELRVYFRRLAGARFGDVVAWVRNATVAGIIWTALAYGVQYIFRQPEDQADPRVLGVFMGVITAAWLHHARKRDMEWERAEGEREAVLRRLEAEQAERGRTTESENAERSRANVLD